MAIQAYLKIKANGSELEGSSNDKKDHAKWSDVHAFSYGAQTQIERGSVLPTGKRAPEPFTVVKPLDKSSPLLFKALCNNEKCEAVLKIWRDNPSGGGRQHYYNIQLKDARVTSIRQYAPLDNSNQGNLAALEEISLMARESIVTWVDGGIEHQEDWFAAGT